MFIKESVIVFVLATFWFQAAVVAANSCGCEVGWTAKGEFCYQRSEAKKTWAYAKWHCGQKGAIMAVPKTQAEITNVLSVSPGDTWIGFKKQHKHFIWHDGKWSRLALSNPLWHAGEPLGKMGQTWKTILCGQLWQGKYDDITCGNTRRYVCQKVCKKATCGSKAGWTKKGMVCYKRPRGREVWEHANDACKKMGASLAMPKTQAELTNVISLGSGSTWIGFREKNGKYIWQDSRKTVISLSNPLWHAGEPKINGAGYTCGQIWNGKYDDSGCWSPKHYVCQKAASY